MQKEVKEESDQPESKAPLGEVSNPLKKTAVKDKDISAAMSDQQVQCISLALFRTAYLYYVGKVYLFSVNTDV